MDFTRPTEPSDEGIVGWMSVAFGVLAIVSHALCCVMGGFSLLFTVCLTGLCIALGVVGFRRARAGGDQHALSLVGLFLGGVNFAVLTLLALVQCYFATLVAAVILAEG